tara:strand:- start:61856 stop:61999 length:144 start_codon:yes stop_codon:yes gene_type:complete
MTNTVAAAVGVAIVKKAVVHEAYQKTIEEYNQRRKAKTSFGNAWKTK